MQEECRPLVESLVSACQRSTIDLIGNLEDSVKALIIVSVKYIVKNDLFKCTLQEGGLFVDWNYIDALKHKGTVKNILGDSTVWLKLMKFIDFGDMSIPETKLRTDMQPLWCIYNSLRSSNVLRSERGLQKAAPSMSFSDVCKLFILNNIEGILSKNITDMFVSEALKSNSFSVSANVLSSMADERHGPEVYLATMKYLLKIMIVQGSELGKHVNHYKRKIDTQKQAWKMKCMQSRITRPSMRAIARSLAGASSICSGVDTESVCSSSQSNSFVGVLTMDRFCCLVRFPNSMSRLLRIRCYLLASQHHFDYRDHTRMLVPLDVSEAMNSSPVLIPDPNGLSAGIASLTMRSRPFKELNTFSLKCFVSFSSSQKKSLTLTDALQLYVSAYQKKDLWKTCWKRVIPIMSTQISKDVEGFVLSHPFAVNDFITLLKDSTPFVD